MTFFSKKRLSIQSRSSALKFFPLSCFLFNLVSSRGSSSSRTKLIYASSHKLHFHQIDREAKLNFSPSTRLIACHWTVVKIDFESLSWQIRRRARESEIKSCQLRKTNSIMFHVIARVETEYKWAACIRFKCKILIFSQQKLTCCNYIKMRLPHLFFVFCFAQKSFQVSVILENLTSF